MNEFEKVNTSWVDFKYPISNSFQTRHYLLNIEN